MNELEIKILNFIKNRLETEFSLKKREVERAIESLRVEFKQPIVASKKRGSEWLLSAQTYKAQILTSQRNLTAIMSVNLEDYWKGHTA